MIFSIFNSEPTIEKIPLSPFADNSFIFYNKDVTLENVHTLFRDNFILSRPILEEGRFYRDASLQHIYSDRAQYIIVDFDKIYSKTSYDKIEKFFMKNDFRVSIFASRSYNNKTLFNCKAVLGVEFITSRENLEACLNMLNSYIGDFCYVDFAACRNASYQAPTNIENLLYLNPNGKCIQRSLIKDFVSEESLQFSIDATDIETDWCKKFFKEKYGAVFKTVENQNGTIQVKLPTEEKTPFSYYWSKLKPYYLFHPSKEKVISCFTEFSNSIVGEQFMQKEVDNKLKKYFQIEGLEQNNVFYEVRESEKVEINNFLSSDVKVLAVKGIMGSGKTNIIKELVSQTDRRILFISMRRTLAFDIYSKYPNTKHYLHHLQPDSKDRYIPGDNLVVQIDSLHKINLEFFDIAVIDEFESFCLYLNQPALSKYYIPNINTVFNIFNNKKIVVVDAFLNSFSLNLYFPGEKKVIINSYKDLSKVYLYIHKQTFFSVLKKIVHNKQNNLISCSFTTLSEMKATKKMLERDNLKVVEVFAETPEQTKNIIIDVLSKEGQVSFDVLLFSPSITVGVSILSDITHHFHFDNGKSVDPVSSIQMTKRSRKAQYIHIFSDSIQREWKSYDNEILNIEMEQKLQNISEQIDKSYFINFDSGGLSKIGQFVNKFKAHFNFYSNYHKYMFRMLLEEQFSNIQLIDKDMDSSNFSAFMEKEVLIKKVKKNLFFGYNLNNKLDIEDFDSNYIPKNEDELRTQILLEVKSKFPMLSNKDVLTLSEMYIRDMEILDKVYLLKTYLTKDIKEIKNELENILVSNPSLLFKESKLILVLNMMIKYYPLKLKNIFSKNELAVLSDSFSTVYLDFHTFLNKLGFVKNGGSMILDVGIKNIVGNIITNIKG